MHSLFWLLLFFNFCIQFIKFSLSAKVFNL